ncbi:MAG: VUT family protein [Eggerthellaceae bacterium]|nr:VUT family protein [Eggerthellaceae bacterium]
MLSFSLAALGSAAHETGGLKKPSVVSDFRYLLRNTPPLIVAMMILSIVGMNLLANKSIDTGLDWLALDCGILFSWMCFLSMDVLTRCFGPRATTLLSIVALVANWVVALIFFIASIIPGMWSASYVEGSEAIINGSLDGMFSGTWFIILGSSVAFIVSAFINNYLNAAIGNRLADDTGFGAFALRSYVSTFVAQVADNLVFAILVSQVFFGWSLLQCFTCALTGALMELLFEVVFSPLGYRMTQGILAERSDNANDISLGTAARAANDVAFSGVAIGMRAARVGSATQIALEEASRFASDRREE